MRSAIAIAFLVVSVGSASAAPATATPSEAEALVERALAELSDDVRGLSHQSALPMAFQAYYAFKTERPAKVRNPYFYFVDYGLNNATPRGWVFDMERLTVVDGPFLVAHGRGSSAGRNGTPTRFGNSNGSAMTSLGLYVAAETYNFSGKAGGGRYTSIGLRMDGMSGRFNSAARSRGVVAHGAPYVTRSSAGRSEGCPAMEQARAQRLLPLLANGGVVFLFSPRDQAWLQSDPWAGGVAS